MNHPLLRLCAHLCPFKRVRKRMKATLKFEKLRRDNLIDISAEDIPFVHLRITGSQNRVRIGKIKHTTGRLTILIHGSGNEVNIDDGLSVNSELLIVAGIPPANFGPVTGVHIHIGKNCSFEDVRIQTFNSHAGINIGERCMFSYGINVYHTDGHPVLDATTGKVLNKVKDMRIGNHVWVGAHATITKNVTIGDDCIIGWGGVVGKSFPEPNCAIAGNPATIIRRGCTWDSNGALHGYISNE